MISMPILRSDGGRVLAPVLGCRTSREVSRSGPHVSLSPETCRAARRGTASMRSSVAAAGPRLLAASQAWWQQPRPEYPPQLRSGPRHRCRGSGAPHEPTAASVVPRALVWRAPQVVTGASAPSARRESQVQTRRRLTESPGYWTQGQHRCRQSRRGTGSVWPASPRWARIRTHGSARSRRARRAVDDTAPEKTHECYSKGNRRPAK